MLSVRGCSRPQGAPPACKPHSGAESVESSCGEGALASVVHSRHLGADTAQVQVTSELPRHFPSRSHNCRDALKLPFVLKPFNLTGAENPTQYLLLSWLILGLFVGESKQQKPPLNAMGAERGTWRRPAGSLGLCSPRVWQPQSQHTRPPLQKSVR